MENLLDRRGSVLSAAEQSSGKSEVTLRCGGPGEGGGLCSQGLRMKISHVLRVETRQAALDM